MSHKYMVNIKRVSHNNIIALKKMIVMMMNEQGWYHEADVRPK